MNFLADESCAGPVIHALREAGHDVVAIAEVAKGTVDELVMERAFGERRMQCGDQALRQAVAARRAIEGEHGDAAQRLAQENERWRRGGAFGLAHDRNIRLGRCVILM